MTSSSSSYNFQNFTFKFNWLSFPIEFSVFFFQFKDKFYIVTSFWEFKYFHEISIHTSIFATKQWKKSFGLPEYANKIFIYFFFVYSCVWLKVEWIAERYFHLLLENIIKTNSTTGSNIGKFLWAHQAHTSTFPSFVLLPHSLSLSLTCSLNLSHSLSQNEYKRNYLWRLIF